MEGIMGLLNMVTGGMCQPSQQGGVVIEQTMEPRFRSPCPVLSLSSTTAREQWRRTPTTKTLRKRTPEETPPMTMIFLVRAAHNL
jgi:hypothetical protein